jgi:hypothetical protein
VVDAIKLRGKYGAKMRHTFEAGLCSPSRLSIT